MPFGSIRYIRPFEAERTALAALRENGPAPRAAGSGIPVVRHRAGVQRMQQLSNRLFWDKKVKIALLALATFIAMC
jgi:hypothetical protein